MNRCIIGDCRVVMRDQIAQGVKVQMCVTSPPYWGLRDYGTAKWEGGDTECDHLARPTGGATGSTLKGSNQRGTWSADGQYRSECGKCGAHRVDSQLGLEFTPQEYVANMVEVFRLVRELLADDGTLWLNLGDTYAAARSYQVTDNKNPAVGPSRHLGHAKPPEGYKQKDLIGIPWRVAFALQQPYYTGKVKDERDRVWLAAMLDAEGSICGTEYTTGDRTKTNIYISVTNTSVPIIDKCERLFPQDVKHVYEKTNGVSNRRCFRWDVERMDTKTLFIREIYPYLVAKRKQAILGYTFLELQRGLESKKKGYLPGQHEQRSWLMASLSKLNAGEDVDLPDWVIEPPSLFEPGFYLRQDLIWSKPNPMPESVRDRCTKSHEYLFLLSKRERYYYDQEAILEPVSANTHARLAQDVAAQVGSARAHAGGKTNGAMKAVGRAPGVNPKAAMNAIGSKQNASFAEACSLQVTERNKRSVWTVTTKPFDGAHFATFPPGLIEPCILAGSRPRDTVLDPFFGSGTVGEVAQNLGRNWLGIELNPAYAKLQDKRTAQQGMVLT